MARDTEKGNISPFLLLLEVITFLLLLFLIARLMIGRVGTGNRYKNPIVSETIEEGTIFDVNKKVLSMQIPVYSVYIDASKASKSRLESALSLIQSYAPEPLDFDKSIVFAKEPLSSAKNYFNSTKKALNSDTQKNASFESSSNYILVKDNFDADSVTHFREEVAQNELTDIIVIKKDQKRIYPFESHGIDIIKETEAVLHDYIKPVPRYNTEITYGSDIYLTLDADIQYLLDSALDKALSEESADFGVGAVIEARNGKIRAASIINKGLHDNSHNGDNGYSYYNNGSGNTRRSAITSNIAGNNTYLLERIINKTADENIDFSLKNAGNLGFYVDDEATIALYTDSRTGLVASIPSLEAPAYYILLGIDLTGSPAESATNTLYTAAEDIQAGLYAQSKM